MGSRLCSKCGALIMPDEDICPRCGNDVRMRSPQKKQSNTYSNDPGGRSGKSAQQYEWFSDGDNRSAIFNVFPPAFGDSSSGKGTEEKVSQNGSMKGGSAPVGSTQDYTSHSDNRKRSSSQKHKNPGAPLSGSRAETLQSNRPETAGDRAIIDVFPSAFGGENPKTGAQEEPSLSPDSQGRQIPAQSPQGGVPFGADPQGGMPFNTPPQGGRTPGQAPQGGVPFGAEPQGGMPFNTPPQGSRTPGQSPQDGVPFGADPQVGAGTDSIRQNDSYKDDSQSRMTRPITASSANHEEETFKKEVTIDQNTWNGWMMSNISLNERMKSEKRDDSPKPSIFSGLFGRKKR